METYTSPRTGKTYNVVRDYKRRVVDFRGGDPVWEETCTHHIYLNHQYVQFSLSEERIPAVIEELENPSPAYMHSRYD